MASVENIDFSPSERRSGCNALRLVHMCHSELGGAGRAAWNLHCGLRELGVDSLFYRKDGIETDAAIHTFSPERGWLRIVERKIRRAMAGAATTTEGRIKQPEFETFGSGFSPWGRQTSQQVPDADLVHLHWVEGFLDPASFFRRFSGRLPIIWTLHDMNPFTGGCHFDDGCGRFRKGCGECPQLVRAGEHDFSTVVWSRKQRGYRAAAPRDVRVVAPSRWLAEEARNSLLFRNWQVDVIPNGTSTEIFSPGDRLQARRELAIPFEERVVMFCADSQGAPRKGGKFLDEALNQLGDMPKLRLITVGSSTCKGGRGVPRQDLGRLNDPSEVAQAFRAADVFVIPSLADNLPNTVLESMACGTPVVGFDVGGIPDMVRPGETGLLARLRDSVDLAGKILTVLTDCNLRAHMSRRCVEVVMAEYTLEKQASTYLKLYEEELERFGKRKSQ